MRKYREAMTRDVKADEYRALIQEKKDDGTFQQIKRAEALRGKITVSPTFPSKVMEINCYKSLEPVLYLEPHKKLQERIDKIKQIKDSVKEEGRPPTNIEAD